MSETIMLVKPQRGNDISVYSKENRLDPGGEQKASLQKPEPVYFKKLNFLSKRKILLENKQKADEILEKRKSKNSTDDASNGKIHRKHPADHAEIKSVTENPLKEQSKTDLVDSIMKKLSAQEAQSMTNTEKKKNLLNVGRSEIKSENHAKSPSLAIPLAMRSVILKKGWLYKRGEYFYSDWHPKWAVLRQELPLEVSMPASESNVSSSALVTPSDVTVSSEFKKHLIEYIPAPVLELYDDRSHMDAKFPPKYRIALSLETDITEVSNAKDPKRHFWDIRLPDLEINEKNLETAKKISTKFQFATFASAEKDNWLNWLRTISCNGSGWFLKYRVKPNSGSQKMQSAHVLQPIVAPSAPSKEDLIAASFEEDQLKQSMTQGKPPCSIQIPDSVPPTVSVLSSNYTADLSYAGVSVLTHQSMLDILSFSNGSKSKQDSCAVTSTLVAAWKGTDWNGIWQRYNPGMSVATIERNLREGIYAFLGDFQNASSHFVACQIDNLHLKGQNDVTEIQGSLKLQILYDDDYMRNLNRLRQLTLYLHSRKLSDRWRPLLRSLVRYKGFSVLVSAQPISPLESDSGQERTLFEEIIPWCHGSELAFDRDTGHVYLLDINRNNTNRVLRHELMLSQVGPHSQLNRNENMFVSPHPEIGENMEKDIYFDRQLVALAAKLDAMDFFPITSGLLVEFMHVHGLNLRDFGQLYHLSRLPHVQTMILLEIVSRSFKVYMRRLLQTAVLHLRSIHATRIEPEMTSVVISGYRKLLLRTGPEDVHFLSDIINEKFSSKVGCSIGSEWREQLDSNVLFDTVNASLGIFWLNIPPAWVPMELLPRESSDSDLSPPLLYSYINFAEFLTVENFGGFMTNMKTYALYPLSYPYFRKASVDGWEGLGILSVSRNLNSIKSNNSCGYSGDCSSILLQNDLLLGHNLSNSMCNSPTELYFADSLKIQSPLSISSKMKPSAVAENPSDPIPFSLLPISAMASQAISMYFSSKKSSFSELSIMQACSPRLAIWFYLLARESFFVRDDLTSAALYLNLAQFLNRKILFRTNSGANYAHSNSDSTFVAMRGNIQLYLQIILLWLQVRLARPTCLSFLKNMESLMDASFKTMTATTGTMHPLSGRLAGTLAASYWQILGSSSSMLIEGSGSPSELSLSLFRTLMHFQRTAVDIYYKSLGKCHFSTRQALLLLGCYGLWDRNSLEDAIAALNEALLQNNTASLTIGMGLTTPYLSLFKADIHIALGEALTRQGNANEALVHVQTAKSIKETVLGADHPQCIQIYYQLASLVGLLVHGGDASDGNIIGNPEAYGILQCGLSCSSRLLHLASWMMTSSSKEHAIEGLACYERIFQFLKYSRVNNTTVVGHLPLSVGSLILSPIRLAVFSPPAIFIDNAKSGSASSDDAYLSTQLHTITKHILALKILILEPIQKEILRRLYKKYAASAQSLSSIVPTVSVDDISTCPISLSSSRQSISLRNDLGSCFRMDLPSTQIITPQSSANIANWKQITDSPLFQSVIMKLIAYSPGSYFSGIIEKLAKYCNGPSIDAVAEQECLCIFALLEE